MTGDAVVRPATVADEPALAELWSTAFTPPLSPAQWLVDGERHPHTIVAEDADGVCGSIYGVRKILREDDGGAAVVHGIGSVAVASRARGRGLARRLVTASVNAADDADWALLFTGTPEVYRSSGFETFAMPRVRTGPWSGSDERHGAAPVDRRRIDGPHVFDAVRETYERSRSGLVLAPVRAERDWAMAAVRLDGAMLYTSLDGSAYVIATIRGTTGVIIDAALAGESAPAGGAAVDDSAADDARRSLLAAVAADWVSAGVTACDIAVPARAGDERAVSAFAPWARRTTDLTGMTRPLRRPPRLDGIRHFTEADYF